jgi:hypothetical protein
MVVISELELPWVVVNPYSTCVLLASLVTQWIVAALEVTELAPPPEIVGATVSAPVVNV